MRAGHAGVLTGGVIGVGVGAGAGGDIDAAEGGDVIPGWGADSMGVFVSGWEEVRGGGGVHGGLLTGVFGGEGREGVRFIDRSGYRGEGGCELM